MFADEGDPQAYARSAKNGLIAAVLVALALFVSLRQDPIGRYATALRDLQGLVLIRDQITDNAWHLKLVQRLVDEQVRLGRWQLRTYSSWEVSSSNPPWAVGEISSFPFVAGGANWAIYSPVERYRYSVNIDPNTYLRKSMGDLRVRDLVAFWNELAQPQYVLWMTDLAPKGLCRHDWEAPWVSDIALANPTSTTARQSDWILVSTADSVLVSALGKINYFGGLLNIPDEKSVAMYFYHDDQVERRNVGYTQMAIRTILIPCEFLYEPLNPQMELRRMARASWRLGTFDESFPVLASIANALPSCSLVELENHLHELADQDAPSVRLLGLELPSADIAGWGALLLIGLLFYVFVMIWVSASYQGPLAWLSLFEDRFGRLLWLLALFWVVSALVLAAIRLAGANNSLVRLCSIPVVGAGLFLSGRIVVSLSRRRDAAKKP
jgi:hypothetical protein